MHLLRKSKGGHNWKKQYTKTLTNAPDRTYTMFVCLQCGIVAKQYTIKGFFMIDEFNTKIEDIYKCPVQGKQKMRRTK